MSLPRQSETWAAAPLPTALQPCPRCQVGELREYEPEKPAEGRYAHCALCRHQVPLVELPPWTAV